MPYLPIGASFVPRDSTSFQPAPTSLTAGGGGVRNDHPHITSPPPHRGVAGEKLHVNFRSQTDYSSEKLFFNLMFAYQASKAALTKSFYQPPYYHYTVTADIPDLEIEGSRMPLMLEVQDENGLTLEQKAMGSFMYDTAGYQQYSTVDDRRKRKISEHPSDYLQSSPKRSASQPLHQARFKDSSGVYSGHQLSNPSGSPYSSNTLFAVPSAYDRPVQQPRSTYVLPLAQRPSYGYSMSPNLAPQGLKARSPSVTTYGSYSALAQSQSPRLSNLQAGSTALSRSVSSTSNSNPPLIRTTILKPPPPVPQPSYGVSHSFNPYAIYPNSKAVLNIVGDLQSMCENWTKEERRESRRLVEFQRSQIGSTITTTFRAVTPDERSPNNPVVSCINWEKKGQCFVTSVDTIALLEALVGVRFTVEEKNRIRRNLEGFKPYTVAKTKDECDDIFRLIMSFPAPKPRNIEKDIKIFPWSILTSALKKIIGKYVSKLLFLAAVGRKNRDGVV
jgi:hypothetical protein